MTNRPVLSELTFSLIMGAGFLAAPLQAKASRTVIASNEAQEVRQDDDGVAPKSAPSHSERKKPAGKYQVDYNDFDSGGPAFDFKAHRSPFEDLIDQDRVGAGYGVRMARVEHPTFVVNYQIANLDGSSKSDRAKITEKYSVNKWNLAAMTNTPVGVRVGVAVSADDTRANFKLTTASSASSDSSSATVKDATMSIMVATVIKEGIGLGLSFVDVDRELSGDNIDSESDHFGYVLPTIYYANRSTEFVGTIFKPMSHDSGDDAGYYELEVEHQLDSFHPVFAVRRNLYPVTSENSRDNYDLSFGGRFFLAKRSNVLAQVHWSDIHYSQSRVARATSVANAGVSARASYWLAPQQCLGAFAAYQQGYGDAKGPTGRSKLEIRGFAVGANYGLRI